MREKKQFGLVVMLFFCMWFCASCGQGSADSSVKTLMETTTAEWPKEIERFAHLQNLGCPLGTVKEDYTKETGMREIRFDIDEEMTQVLVDGYAKAVWEACLAVSDAQPHSCNYYRYESFKGACRRQEPLDYYIWYYFVDQREYRVGIYPTMMEEGEPGGLVLRIEKWD